MEVKIEMVSNLDILSEINKQLTVALEHGYDLVWKSESRLIEKDVNFKKAIKKLLDLDNELEGLYTKPNTKVIGGLNDRAERQVSGVLGREN